MSLDIKTIQYIQNNCKCNLTGKHVLITGANSGIGFKTAETMVYLEASVILACRSINKAEIARSELLRDYPNADIKVMQLDIADFSSIDQFATNLPDVDVFINNAGIFHHPHQVTKDGFELVMGTNYMGVYYLGKKVLPLLEKCGHDVTYVITSSIVHKYAHINYNKFFDKHLAYSRSKLCLARYAEYLARKYKDSNIHIYTNHPGLAVTPIANHILGGFYTLSKIIPFNTAEKSSLSVAYILANNVPDGCVVGPNKVLGIWGYPEINKKLNKINKGIDELIDISEHEVYLHTK